MLRRAAFLAGLCATATAGFHLYRMMTENIVSVSVTEEITLPEGSTESFTPLSMQVDGNIRLDTNMLDTCEFLMKLNSAATGRMSNSGSFAGSPSASGRGRGPKVGPLQNIKLNDMCDAELMAATGNIQFTPPCVGASQPLVSYKAPVADDFIQPLSMKNCVVAPSSVPGARRLGFDVFLNVPVLEASVTIIFPKGSRVVQVNHQKVGEWHLINPGEMVWNLGCLSGQSGSEQPTAAAASTPTGLGESYLGGGGNPVTSGNGALQVISFEVVYTANEEAYDESVDDGRKLTKAEKKRREEEHRSVVVPGICVAYSTNYTASGLNVRKLQTLKSRPNANWWGVPTVLNRQNALTGDVAEAAAATATNSTAAQKKTLTKRVKYVTRFIQYVRAEVQL